MLCLVKHRETVRCTPVAVCWPVPVSLGLRCLEFGRHALLVHALIACLQSSCIMATMSCSTYGPSSGPNPIEACTVSPLSSCSHSSKQAQSHSLCGADHAVTAGGYQASPHSRPWLPRAAAVGAECPSGAPAQARRLRGRRGCLPQALRAAAPVQPAPPRALHLPQQPRGSLPQGMQLWLARSVVRRSLTGCIALQLELWNEALEDLAVSQRLAQACPTTSEHTFAAYIKTFERKGAALSGTSRVPVLQSCRAAAVPVCRAGEAP